MRRRYTRRSFSMADFLQSTVDRDLETPISWEETHHFPSVESFVVKASEPESEPALGRGSRDDSNSFSGGSWDDACRLAATGWPEGTEQIRAIASKISVPELTEAVTQSYYDTAGSYVDVDRYLSSEPECMIEFAPDARTKRIVRIGFEACYSSVETHVSIQNRGAAIGALVDILESRGIRCEVVATVHVRRGYSEASTGIKLECVLKTPEQPLDLDRIAFACAHPAFLRRLVFAWEETLPHDFRVACRAHSNGGYILPWCGVAPEYDVFVSTRLAANWTQESSIKFVNDSLAKILKGTES